MVINVFQAYKNITHKNIYVKTVWYIIPVIIIKKWKIDVSTSLSVFQQQISCAFLILKVNAEC